MKKIYLEIAFKASIAMLFTAFGVWLGEKNLLAELHNGGMIKIYGRDFTCQLWEGKD